MLHPYLSLAVFLASSHDANLSSGSVLLLSTVLCHVRAVVRGGAGVAVPPSFSTTFVASTALYKEVVNYHVSVNE